MRLIHTVAGFAFPPAALAPRLLTWVRGAAVWLRTHPCAAIALLAVTFGGIEHHQAHKWANLARQRGTSLAAVQSANSRAIRQAAAAKEMTDDANRKLAAAGDRHAADLRSHYHAAVMQLAAAQDRARRADLSGDADAPARRHRSSDGPGISAGAEPGPPESPVAGIEMPLAISRDDALTCADNTARLQAVHDWAAALSDETAANQALAAAGIRR